jgi:hypothetical protein
VKDLNESVVDICNNCNGLKIIDNYKPQPTFLTDNPEPFITETKELCCNPEKNALKGVIYASQNCQNANYYPNSSQYLQNKCMTYDQKVFGFVRQVAPNSYLTNCQPYATADCSSVVIPDIVNNVYIIATPITDPSTCNSCKVSVYKPNNKPFAVEGSVRSSTRTAKLVAETLESNYQMIYNEKTKVENLCDKCSNIKTSSTSISLSSSS